MIERSSGYFHSGEANFKDGNFDKARRDYDRAIDIVLESGIDVRSDARLQQHYQALVDNIFRRQMTLLSAAPAASSVVATVEDLQQSPTQNPSSKETSAGKKSEKQTEDRGFGQQTFAPSPLDELAKIKLTEDETKGVSEAQVETAVAAAQLDFNFRPNSLAAKPPPESREGVPKPVYTGSLEGAVGLYEVRFTVPAVPPGTPPCA
ncbi:MAG TPA: hypothetical protein PKD31_24430, partial [Blastocatellia bacterium]|nr:hypothetical protein [Blastocatellia bacterium]